MAINGYTTEANHQSAMNVFFNRAKIKTAPQPQAVQGGIHPDDVVYLSANRNP
jgi:hypothetical protein